MTTMKSTSKKAQYYIQGYRRSRKTRLSDCYGRYSTLKARAEWALREEMKLTGGEDFRITSHSQNFFTCGWTTAEGNLRIETVSHSYLIILD